MQFICNSNDIIAINKDWSLPFTHWKIGGLLTGFPHPGQENKRRSLAMSINSSSLLSIWANQSYWLNIVEMPK